MNDELRHYLMVLKRRWLPLVLSFILVLAVSLGAALWLPPVFRSAAVILVESQQIPDELVRSTVTSLPDERIQIIEQRVMTRDNVLRIIQKFDLYEKERRRLSSSELVELMRASSSIEPVSFRNIRQQADKLTIAFTVWFEHERPEVAVRVANELVTLILDENVRSRTRRASETAKFLQREVQRRQKLLSRIEGEIAQYKQENRESLPENLAFRLSTLDRAQDNLSAIEAQMRTVQEERKLYELGLSTNGSDMGSGQNLVAKRYEELQAELIRKSATYSDSHPDIKWLKRELAGVESELNSQAVPSEDAPVTTASTDAGSEAVPDTNTAITSRNDLRQAVYEQRLALLQIEKVRLDERIASLSKSISRTPQVELGLKALGRNYEGVQEQYQDLLEKLADAELGETLEEDKQAERFEVIEQPTLPQVPIKPNRIKIAAFGFFLAVAASGGSLIALESVDSSVRGSAHLVSAINRRPIVSIPYMSTLRENRRKRRMIYVIIAAVIIAILLMGVAIHFFYMPLDLVSIKLRTYLPI